MTQVAPRRRHSGKRGHGVMAGRQQEGTWVHSDVGPGETTAVGFGRSAPTTCDAMPTHPTTKPAHDVTEMTAQMLRAAGLISKGGGGSDPRAAHLITAICTRTINPYPVPPVNWGRLRRTGYPSPTDVLSARHTHQGG
ncbi:unnamed protein product [Boreogadus saida]